MASSVGSGTGPRRKYSDLDPSTFRRRMPPKYEVFDTPIPADTDMYTYDFQKGLITVQYKGSYITISGSIICLLWINDGR